MSSYLFALFFAVSSLLVQDSTHQSNSENLVMGDEIMLRIVPTADCTAGTFCGEIQLTAVADSFLIGTSSIFLTYDPAVITFSSYTSLNFDGSDNCIAGVAAAWDPHAFDGTSVAGSFNLTLNLLSNNFSCPPVTMDDWIPVGNICFSIVNQAGNPNLTFVDANTNFNRASPNDGTMAIDKSTFTGYNQVINCQSCPPAGTPCDDSNPATENDLEDGNCNCVGTPCPPAGTACDDGNPATGNDQEDGNCNCVGTPCPPAGTACDDGNPATGNDQEDGNCNCVGTPCPPAGTTCDDGNPATENDQEDGNCNCVGTPCPPAGTACDDGNPATGNDQEDGNCNCVGTPCPPAGTACDDGNAATENDQEDGNCNCVGTPCPPAGTACDDGNPATENDQEDGNCNCVGTPCPPAGTTCDDGNPATENDQEDGNCNCVGTPCPPAGTACDDGNPLTQNDQEDGNCNCAGIDPSGNPDRINLQMVPTADCNAGTYCVDIQIQAESDTFAIGTSSIFLNYNTASITYDGYTSTSFDGTDLCISGVAPAWSPHAIDGVSSPGAFNLTLNLLNSQFSCPVIDTGWVSVGTVCFVIADSLMDPALSFNSANTNFNRASPNNGTQAIPKGTLTGISGLIDCACPNVGEVCDDGNPLTRNDTIDVNCICVGEPCPAVGTLCDDGNPGTINDQYDANCNCVGVPCPPVGTLCDDGNPATINDMYDADCNCVGEPVTTDTDRIQIELDPFIDCSQSVLCANILVQAAEDSFLIGDSRIYIEYDSSVIAYENYIPTSFDGSSLCIGGTTAAWEPHTTSLYEPGRFGIGLSLTDSNYSCPAVSVDLWTVVGTVCFSIKDSLGNPQINVLGDSTYFNRGFPNLPSNRIPLDSLNGVNIPINCGCSNEGDACDDGNPLTLNDTINADCECVGTPCPPAGTSCDDGNPNTINDAYDDSCNCVGEPCPEVGTACDDGNPLTINDTYNELCECMGIPCPDEGTSCDDGDPSTVNDAFDANCNCVGEVPDGCVAYGELLYERWLNVSGRSVKDLKDSPDFPDYPSAKVILTESFTAPINVADDFGTRISGLLCPPQSGSYTFFISGDDATELWLSSDETRLNRELIAYNLAPTSPLEITKEASQKSEPVVLVAGKTYYMEALSKDVDLEDHLAVAWVAPDSTFQETIPAAYFSLPPRSYVAEPICLIPIVNSFTATILTEDMHVILNWIANENTGEPFIVEKSNNLVDFFEIGRLGVNDGQPVYEFVDTTEMYQKNYYRIRKRTGEGVCFSPTILAAFNQVFFIDLFPNPSQGDLTVGVRSGENGQAHISIVDATGRLVKEEEVDIVEGNQFFQFELDHLSEGVYYIQVKGLGTVDAKRWLIYR